MFREVLNYIMGKEKLESAVDAEFVRKLKDLPFQVAAKKIHGYGIGNQNEPDWFICVHGRFLLIETKRNLKKDKTKKARIEGQKIRAKWWRRAGAIYFRCDTADDMIDAVKYVWREQQDLIDKVGGEIY